ncbi:hypothetical protein OS42_45970 [Dickeya oryzae]
MELPAVVGTPEDEPVFPLPEEAVPELVLPEPEPSAVEALTGDQCPDQTEASFVPTPTPDKTYLHPLKMA